MDKYSSFVKYPSPVLSLNKGLKVKSDLSIRFPDYDFLLVDLTF